MKIIHLIANLKRGGTERQLSLMVASEVSGIEEFILGFSECDYSYIQEYGLEKKYIVVKGNRVIETYKWIKAVKPDYVVAWSYKESIVGLFTCLLTGVKFVNASLKHGIFQGRRMDYIRKIVYHLSPMIISNSHAGLRANGLKRGNVIYNGLSEKFYAEVKNNRRQSSASSDLRLISLGNLTRIKNHRTAIEVVRTLKVDSKVVYDIYGNGPLRANLVKNAEDYSSQGKQIRINSNTPNVMDRLNEADILLHLSYGEGCSNTILEAMACGVCVIASNTGGTPEIVQDGRTGFLFAPDDIKGIKSQIELLARNPDLIVSIGNEAKIAAISRFSPDRYVSEFRNLLT